MPETELSATGSAGESPRPVASPGQSRRGRPRADEAGQVEARLLDAANSLFLRQGYDRTSMDQVSKTAGASKTTVYARFPTKRDLFAAIVRRQGEHFAARMPTAVPGDLRDRLTSVGLALIREALTADTIALMRITCAEADAFPEVARDGFQIGFGYLVEAVRRTLPPGLDDGDPEQRRRVATRFVELALHPLFMHALYGADLEVLRTRAQVDIPLIAALLADPRFGAASTGAAST